MKNIGSMRFQISRNFEKMRIFKEISRIFEFFEFSKKERQDNWGMERHSTSSPCGNLVDGLPHDCQILVVDFMFLMIFHIMSYWFVTFKALVLDQTSVNKRAVFSLKMMKNEDILKFR